MKKFDYEIEDLAAGVVGRIYWLVDSIDRTSIDIIGEGITARGNNYGQAEVEMLQVMLDVLDE